MTVDEFIAKHGVTVLPDGPVVAHRTGSRRRHLLALLQQGDKSVQELQAYFGSKKELTLALKSLRQITQVFFNNGMYSLEKFND